MSRSFSKMRAVQASQLSHLLYCRYDTLVLLIEIVLKATCLYDFYGPTFLCWSHDVLVYFWLSSLVVWFGRMQWWELPMCFDVTWSTYMFCIQNSFLKMFEKAVTASHELYLHNTH